MILLLFLIASGAGAFFFLEEGPPAFLSQLLKGDHEIIESTLLPLKNACKNGAEKKCKLIAKAEAPPSTIASVTSVLVESCTNSVLDDAYDCVAAGRLIRDSEIATYGSHCREDNPKNCIIVATRIASSPNLNQADVSKYLQVGCMRESLPSCIIWSQRLNADEVQKLSSECSEKTARSCLVLGTHSDFLKKPDDAKRFLDQSCTLGDFWGCGLYGAHIDGDSEIESLKPSCTPENPQSCFKISGYYFFKKQDFEKAKQFNSTACSGKPISFCANLKGYY